MVKRRTNPIPTKDRRDPQKGYNIARRTVAKYREQLNNIPVARLRKELWWNLFLKPTKRCAPVHRLCLTCFIPLLPKPTPVMSLGFFMPRFYSMAKPSALLRSRVLCLWWPVFCRWRIWPCSECGAAWSHMAYGKIVRNGCCRFADHLIYAVVMYMFFYPFEPTWTSTRWWYWSRPW